MTTMARPIKLDAEAQELLKARSLWGDAWRQFRKHKMAMIASVLLIFIVLTVIIGPLLWTLDPQRINITEKYSSMNAAHPLGSDSLGRDTLARVLFGGRISLAIGISAMMIAMFLGTLVGLLAGYYRPLDNFLMRITDMFLSLPILPLLLVITLLFRDSLREVLGPELGIFILTVTIIGALGWMPTARLVRGEVLAVKGQEFVLAAHSIGSPDWRILFGHILRNVLSPVIVAATFSIASAIITEAALSFLGLGFPPDFPTWGALLFANKDKMNLAPMLVIWPGLFISLTVLCVNFIGDGLRDALDPKMRK